ncbi:MAG: ferrous iron transport protein A [Gammaproteobacteria bacterium]|jgi:ferrous iron transport protein A|nr:ferrous iron transport protein A [Gammaproteobacteria bacterium]MBT4492184.1 ferrous iron transport protein A [Gammaproteobacteria bacterium]
MNLAEVLPEGRCRIISAAEEHRDFQSRLYALGLYPGAQVDVLHIAPLGDPLQVRIGHTLLSIRRQEASMVEVEVVDE